MARVARIPQIEAERGLDTQRSSVPNYQIDMSPYQAQQDLGNTIASSAFKLAERYKAKQDEMAGYKAERAFQKFQTDAILDQQAYDEDPNTDPSGENYLKNYTPRYEQLQSEFESTLPENLRNQYGPKLENFKGQLVVKAAEREVGKRNEYYETTLDMDADGLSATAVEHPEMSDQIWSNIENNVNLSGLSPIKKAQKLETYRKKLNESTVKGFTNQGKFEEARDFIQHLNPAPPVIESPKAKGVVGGSATDLIKHFEGYKSSAYWDVNHHRVGYGSDTVTTPEGKVVTVGKDTKVTRADAERDLNRRVGQFQTIVSQQITKKVWDSLPEHTKAGLTSVAYNYGELPKSVAEAAKTGDPKAIAAAVRARASDNDGVNSKRRKMEANVIVGRGGVQVSKSVNGPDVSDLLTTSDPSTRGKRPDGSAKGSGFLGLLKRPDGGVSSEISISTDVIGGKDFPLLVPTLTRGEVDQILAVPVNDPKFFQKIPRSAIKKAEAFAKDRVAAGKSPFADESDNVQQSIELLPNRINSENWTLKNFEPWEFGDSDDVSTPIGAAFDIMTGALDKKYSFKYKDDQIKIKVEGLPEEEKLRIIAAAQSAGFNSFEGTRENKTEYITLGMHGDVKNHPEWIVKGEPKVPEWVSKNLSRREDVSPAVTAGPNFAYIPRGNPEADKLMDEIERAELAADSQREKETKKVQDEVAKNGWDLVRQGKMSDSWLDDNKDALSEVDFRMFVKQQLAEEKAKKEGKEPKPYETDQSTFVALMKRSLDPKDREVVRDAIDSQTKNLISKTDFNKIFDTYNKTVSEGALGKPADWKPALRKYLADKIIKNPDDPEDTKYMDDRINSLFELDDFMREHPDATRNQVRAEVDNLLKKYNGAIHEDKRANLPMDALPGVGRYENITPLMLKTSAQKWTADYKAGKISKEVYAARIKELSQWSDLISEEAKSR